MSTLMDAFRAGVLHAASRFDRAFGKTQRFTANDVSLFLTMEAAEVDEDDLFEILTSPEDA